MKMMAEADARWHTTASEKIFLDGLGSYHPRVMTPRITLLNMYLAIIPKISRWGGVDPTEIKRYVIFLIREEEKRLFRNC